MNVCRGMKFRSEDDAYDYFRQREIDESDEEERLRMENERQQQQVNDERE